MFYYRFAVYKKGKLLFKVISNTEHGAYEKFMHEGYERRLDVDGLKHTGEYTFVATYSKEDNIDLVYRLGFKNIQTGSELKKNPNIHRDYLILLQKRYGSNSNLDS